MVNKINNRNETIVGKPNISKEFLGTKINYDNDTFDDRTMIKFDVETLFFTTNNNKGAPVKLIVTTYTLKKAKVTQYFPSKESKRSEEENTNLGTIQNTSPEEKKTELNEAETHEREKEPNTAVNNEQNIMTPDIIKITLMELPK